MAQFAADAFGGTAGDDLSTYSADWTEHSSYSSGQAVITDAGRIRGSTINATTYYHSGTPASADYSVQADVVAKETNGGAAYMGLAARLSTSANTMYHARYAGGAQLALQLYKFVAGTATQLGSSVSTTMADEQSSLLKLECIGTAIKLYWNGSSSASISQTDSAISAAGKAGIRIPATGEASTNTTGLHLDNFSADDAGSTTYTLSAPTYVPGSLGATGLTARVTVTAA